MNMPINRHPEVIATRPPSVRPEDGGGLINIAGVEIRGTPTFLGWIGGKNPAGQLVQGALKSARDEKGNWIFWLEGKGTNYLLKNDKGALITNQSDAKDRAREMIKWGEASDLRPLESEHVEKPSSDELKLRFQFLRYLGIPDLFLQVKLGTVDGRYAVQTKTGTYWVPSGLTTDKEIRDWLRSAIAADAISNAYPLGGLTPGERAAAQRYPETLRVDLEDPAINPRAGDGRGMMGRPDRFVPGLHSDYACKHACYIAERYGLTVKKWLEPTPHWHIQPKAHAVVEIPNTRQGGKIYARMNFEEVGYHGSQASPVAWVRPGELKLPPQASPAFIEGLKDEARAMGWQNVQVIGSMLVFGLLQAGAMRQRVRPPGDRSDGKPPSVGGLTIEMQKDPKTGVYNAVFPENMGNKPPVRQTLPQIQPQTKPVPTVRNAPPVPPVPPVSAPKPAPISPQQPPQRALPPHARHGDPFKPDPAQLRAERESVNVEYLPLKERYADPAYLLGSIFDLQQHFPLTAELLRAHGLSAGDVLRSMHERRITALEAAVQLSPERFAAVRSVDRHGFATHGAAYATSSDYDGFASLQSGVAVDLLHRGVPASVVAKLIAEGKQQFTLWHRPDRTVEFNRSIRPGNVNPTWLLSDPESAGIKPEYRAAVRRILDFMVSDPSLPRFQLMDRSVLGLGLKDFEHFIAGVDRADAWEKNGERIRNPQWVAERLAAAIENPGRYELPVLPLSVIRIPLNTPYGTGGAIYIREIAPDAARIGPTDTMAMPSGARFVDVLLDQGTAALHSSGVPMREFVSGEAHRRLDALTSVDDSRTELEELAGAWWDLSVTAGGQMAGGAGTNHILVAAKYEQLTGKALPPLAVPADLLAVSTTRDRFIAAFLGGDLFRSADHADAVGTTQASTVGAELQWPYNQAQQQLQIEQLRNQRAQQAEQYGDRPQSPQQQQAAESPEQQRRNDIQRRLQRLAVEAPNAHQMLVWMCGDAKRDGWAVQKHFHLSFSTYMQYVNAINTYLGTNGLSDAVKLAKPLVLTGTDAPADSDKVPEITTQNFAALVDAGRVSRASSIDYANELLPAELFSTLNDDEAMLVGLIARGAVESREVLYGQPLNEALRRMGERVPDAARCIRSALDKLGARVDLHHQPGAANRALLHRLHQIGSDNFRNQLEMALGAQPLVEFGRYAARADASQPRGRLAKPSASPQPP
ncbi:MAG: hypothetical protein ING69_01660, partial [Rhodocyclaceae bacterium]|nr:hypothetical protein [Rhodocyclaceae bacterium]